MCARATPTPTSPLYDSLAAVWLTDPLPAAVRARLAEMGRLRNVSAGEVLMTEGEPNDTLGIVLNGRIGLRLRVPERGSVTILTVEPGDVVGWSALVPPYRATSTAVAQLDTELAHFDGPTLRAALDEQDELAAQVYPLLLRAVARRLEGTRMQLLDLFTQRWVDPW